MVDLFVKPEGFSVEYVDECDNKHQVSIDLSNVDVIDFYEGEGGCKIIKFSNFENSWYLSLGLKNDEVWESLKDLVFKPWKTKEV